MQFCNVILILLIRIVLIIGDDPWDEDHCLFLKNINHNMTKPFLFFALLIMLSACHKLVQDRFPPFEKTLAISGFVSNDSMVAVHVSTSAEISVTPINGITNAHVMVYAGADDTIYAVHEGEGWYVAGIVPEVGREYHCEVTAPGSTVVHASAIMPNPPVLQQLVHTAIAGKDEEGTSYPSLSFTFENNPAETKYYEARIRLFWHDEEWQATLINTNDPILLNEGLPVALFSNELISGNTYTMTINYMTGGAGSSGPYGEVYTNLYPFIFELRAICYDYYQYARSVEIYKTGRYPEFGLHANHVFTLHSNTSSGFGVFAAYSVVQSDTIYPSYPEQ
jgi:hypothetical protein